jgi:hypothetical protein
VAVNRVVVDHACCLHEGVADGGAHKAHARPLQCFTQRLCLWRPAYTSAAMCSIKLEHSLL